MLDRVFVIVVIEDDRKIYELSIEHNDDTPYRERRPGSWYHGTHMDPVTRSWSRRKEHTFESFEKSLFKVFPTAIELVGQCADFQEEVNRLTEYGEVYHFYVTEYGVRENPATRMDANGEWVSLDDIPLRLINVMTGVPYPKPPPGQQRYTVGVTSSNGISYNDVHKMIMAATPRDAALEVIEFLDNGGGMTGQFAGMFQIKRHQVGMVMVTDKDTEQTTFFRGANADQNADDIQMTKTWGRMFSAEEEGDEASIDSILMGMLPGLKGF